MFWIIFGTIIAIASSVRFVPQALKTFKTKEVEDISSASIWWSVITGYLWVLYNINAIFIAGPINFPYLFNNLVQVLSTTAILVMIYMYRSKK